MMITDKDCDFNHHVKESEIAFHPEGDELVLEFTEDRWDSQSLVYEVRLPITATRMVGID